MKTWQGRIGSPTDPRFEVFTSSVGHDRRLALYDVMVSKAHAQALARAGVIGEADAARLEAALDEVAENIASGEFVWRDDLEDVHTHVESALRDRVGRLADALHAGRSRNDQIAADLRLFVQDATRDALAAILVLQRALLDLATRCESAVMPGYTHLQQAQPVLIAQPLLAYVAMLGRDWERLSEGVARANRSPLGSGALAGATLELDRDFLAERCGFSAPISNSVDAVSDRDFLVEFVFDAALCMTHLSRLAEDLVLWSSSELGFVRLPDGFASGSSMMPQKKNPDVPELVRGKAALVIGDVAAALALVKGLPLAYNRDLQEDKTPLFHAADSLLSSLRILGALMPHLEFDTARAEAAISPFTLATDLADSLVEKGVPFREAHEIVAGLVARCIAEGTSPADLEPADFQAASPLFDGVPDLRPAASVARKRTSGSTHPDEVRAQIVRMETEIAERQAWLEKKS